jgi:hypothetical protein
MNHIKSPRFPLGCDQQGRYPEAAHAASEHDDEPELTLSDRVLHWLTPSRFWTLYALVIGAAVLGVWFARGAV